MICTKVSQVKGKRSGGITLGTPVEGKGGITYRVSFDTLGANEYDAIIANAGSNGAVPAFGATIGPFVVYDKQGAENPDDPREWLVTVGLCLPRPGIEPAPEELDTENGSRWAIEININTTPFETEVQRNVGGKMLRNSAKDPVTGITLPRDDEDITISFTTNLVFWDAIDRCYDAYGRGCVNSTDVALVVNGEPRIYAPGTLRFRGYQLGITVDPSGAVYSRMTLHLTWRTPDWRFRAADKGVYQLVGDDDLHVPIRDDQGIPISTPGYLDGAGQPLAEGADAFILSDPSDAQEGFEIIGSADLGTLLLWGLHT
jgi:hypothetical protein